VGPRGGVDECGKSRPHRHSIPDRPARISVAIPTELPGPPLVAMLTLICQMCFALRTFPVLFILVSCNTSLIRPLNCINRNVPHLFLAIGRSQSVYSRQWLVTISECTLLDLSVTRLSCSFVESFKSLMYLILCLYLAFLPK